MKNKLVFVLLLLAALLAFCYILDINPNNQSKQTGDENLIIQTFSNEQIKSDTYITSQSSTKNSSKKSSTVSKNTKNSSSKRTKSSSSKKSKSSSFKKASSNKTLTTNTFGNTIYLNETQISVLPTLIYWQNGKLVLNCNIENNYPYNIFNIHICLTVKTTNETLAISEAKTLENIVLAPSSSFNYTFYLEGSELVKRNADLSCPYIEVLAYCE